MVFSGADATAQRAHGGYTYTQRVCQEYGQQPRHYNVRDGQAAYNGGNSDSGWLIVLIRSAGARERTGYRFTTGDNTNAWTGYTSIPLISVPAHGVDETIIIDHHDGRNAFNIYQADGTLVTSGSGWEVVIDQDRNGVIDTADRVPYPLNPSLWIYMGRYAFNSTYYEEYGATYIRWAHMMWCR